MLHVILWKWNQEGFRERYNSDHVNIMAGMIRPNLEGMEHRIVVVTDDPVGVFPSTETFPLWKDHHGIANITGKHLPSCYRRLKIFDESTQVEMGIKRGDRIASIDLDSIVMGDLRATFNQIDKSGAAFAGWGVRGTYHQMVFNGSFFSFLAGPDMQYVWSTFNPLESPKTALTKGFLGSDQGWLSLNFAKHTSIYPVRYPDFASYPREVRRAGVLDRRTKIVFFHGSRKPWHREEWRAQPWIQKYWRVQQ